MTEDQLKARMIAFNAAPDNFFTAHKEEINEVQDKLAHMFQNAPDAETVVQVVHNIMDDFQTKAKFKEALQCGKQQCSFCCHSEIFIGKPEADHIKKHAKYEIDQERLAKQRATKDYTTLSFADKACIMLKDGRCQVYAHRPALCRNHGVNLGEDPKLCEEQSMNLGIPGAPPVNILQPRMIVLEAMSTFVTTFAASGIQDIKNIAEYNWEK
jgi:Fe-S-cluster containining protein